MHTLSLVFLVVGLISSTYADFSLSGSSWGSNIAQNRLSLSGSALASESGVVINTMGGNQQGSCSHKIRQTVEDGFKTAVKFSCQDQANCAVSVSFRSTFEEPLYEMILGVKECRPQVTLGANTFLASTTNADCAKQQTWELIYSNSALMALFQGELVATIDETKDTFSLQEFVSMYVGLSVDKSSPNVVTFSSWGFETFNQVSERSIAQAPGVIPAAPVASPVAVPVSVPVSAPLRAPVATPVSSPVAATPVFVIPAPRCGNNIVENGEQCDGGQHCNATSCLCVAQAIPTMPFSRNCIENTCPNGRLDFGEQCDGGSGCNAQCRCEAGTVPTSPPSTACTTCGNGRIDAGEQCDGGSFCVSCQCSEGYQPTSPVSDSCQPIVAPTNARVVPILECYEASGNSFTAYVGWNNLESSSVTIAKGPLNFFTPVTPSGGDRTVFESGVHIGYPNSPIELSWTGATSLTWKLSDFALVIDTTDAAARCPEEVTLQITLTVSSGTSMTPQQQVDLTLELAALLGVSPARLTVVFQTTTNAAKRQTSTLAFTVTIAPPTNDSLTQQSTANAVSSFITRVQADDNLLRNVVQTAAPNLVVEAVNAAPQPLPTIQMAQTGVSVPIPPSVAVPISTPAAGGSRPPRATVSSSSVITSGAILFFFSVFALF